MPRIKRWFPVSHDINADAEVWTMRHEIGEKSLSIWLEFLSIADRNEGELPGDLDELIRLIAGRCQATKRTVSAVYQFALSRLWLTSQSPLKVTKWAKYHRTQEQKPAPSEPSEPSDPILPKNQLAAKPRPLEKKMPEWKAIADTIFESDPKRFGRLMQLINWAAKEMYSEAIINAGLEKLWRGVNNGGVDNWWAYARKCFEKAYTEDQQGQSAKHREENRKFIASLVHAGEK